MGPDGLHLVQPTDGNQGTWGVYEHIPPLGSADGWPVDGSSYLLPNRDVPNTQVTGKGIGWDATDSWLIEFQVWLMPSTKFVLTLTSDADVDFTSPDNVHNLVVSTETGDLKFSWDDRTGVNGHYGDDIVSGVIAANRWYHVAMQKNTGSDDIRVYLDGLLIITENAAYPMSNHDLIRFLPQTGASMLREFNMRTLSVYPITPFTPGPVTFATAIGDTQRRWNSYVLI